MPSANSSYCQVCSGLSPPSNRACRAHYRIPRSGIYRAHAWRAHLAASRFWRDANNAPQAQIMPRCGNSRGRSPQFMQRSCNSCAAGAIHLRSLFSSHLKNWKPPVGAEALSRSERVRPARLLTIRTARPAFSSEANTFIGSSSFCVFDFLSLVEVYSLRIARGAVRKRRFALCIGSLSQAFAFSLPSPRWKVLKLRFKLEGEFRGRSKTVREIRLRGCINDAHSRRNVLPVIDCSHCAG